METAKCLSLLNPETFVRSQLIVECVWTRSAAGDLSSAGGGQPQSGEVLMLQQTDTGLLARDELQTVTFHWLPVSAGISCRQRMAVNAARTHTHTVSQLPDLVYNVKTTHDTHYYTPLHKECITHIKLHKNYAILFSFFNGIFQSTVPVMSAPTDGLSL